jgi:3-deoxy-manno-octulosonate cytidylyltransferase (CMP-KDO synthetase)
VFRVVIPARYGSSRFPGKPLVEIAGRPLLAWVYARAAAAGAAEVLIATDDARIAALGAALGASVVMTRADHPSGTDRIAEVAAQRAWDDATIVVNLQGDEPLMPVTLLRQVAATLDAHPAAAIATVATPILALEEFLDPNVVKVVTDPTGRALYFSRAPIPWDRDAGEVPARDAGDAGDGSDGGGATASAGVARRWSVGRRHIGLYAYRVGALRRLAAFAPTPLEALERLEQLRALEHGMEIRVLEASERPGADVNTPADLARVAAALAASGAPGG